MSAPGFLKSLLPYEMRRYLRDQLVRFQVKHVCGPDGVELAEDETVVTTVEKNGEYYIEDFIQHYTRLGVRHIFILDNCSTDNTVAIASKHDNVTIWQSSLCVGSYQGLLQRFLLRGIKSRGWCINADIDELFDFPWSTAISLQLFLRYLNGRNYTAAVSQLLDMFADKPLSYLHEMKVESPADTYRLYDLSDILRVPYHEGQVTRTYGGTNLVSNQRTELFYGGIRKSLYGSEWYTNCLLTKHSLFRLNSGLHLFRHVHFVDRARLADVSCVMRHYKLASNVIKTATQNRVNLHGVSKGYDALLRFVLENPGFELKRITSAEWQDANRLVEAGFLFASDEYRDYVEANSPASQDSRAHDEYRMLA